MQSPVVEFFGGKLAEVGGAVLERLVEDFKICPGIDVSRAVEPPKRPVLDDNAKLLGDLPEVCVVHARDLLRADSFLYERS